MKVHFVNILPKKKNLLKSTKMYHNIILFLYDNPKKTSVNTTTCTYVLHTDPVKSYAT